MYNLANFTLGDMTECSSDLRKIGVGARSMEEVADRIVHYFYDRLIEKETGEKSCMLIRFYKTHPYDELDAELREFASATLSGTTGLGNTKCLTLLGTVGKKPEWNSRKNSIGHKAIPLPSDKIISQFPMISQFINQFGLEVSALLKPDPTLLVDLEKKTYNVFFVPEAIGSPYIPAQKEFVIPFGIKSVLGFGGMLPSGDLFIIIMFTKVHIPRETADMFKTLSLSVKVAVLPFSSGIIFT